MDTAMQNCSKLNFFLLTVDMYSYIEEAFNIFPAASVSFEAYPLRICSIHSVQNKHLGLIDASSSRAVKEIQGITIWAGQGKFRREWICDTSWWIDEVHSIIFVSLRLSSKK